jgi:hypothetical protein
VYQRASYADRCDTTDQLEKLSTLHFFPNLPTGFRTIRMTSSNANRWSGLNVLPASTSRWMHSSSVTNFSSLFITSPRRLPDEFVRIFRGNRNLVNVSARGFEDVGGGERGLRESLRALLKLCCALLRVDSRWRW